MQKIQLTIRTLEKELFTGEVSSVDLPGVLGRFQILSGHAPLISQLEKGNIYYTQEGNRNRVLIRGGIAKVLDNSVKVLVGGAG